MTNLQILIIAASVVLGFAALGAADHLINLFTPGPKYVPNDLTVACELCDTANYIQKSDLVKLYRDTKTHVGDPTTLCRGCSNDLTPLITQTKWYQSMVTKLPKLKAV
jgi:hypothetical protein